MFVLDTLFAQLQQWSKSQTYLKGKDGAGRLKLSRIVFCFFFFFFFLFQAKYFNVLYLIFSMYNY